MAAAADSGSQHFRAPARVVNHLEETQRFLLARGYQQVQLLASYPGYMTGLMFHKYEEKPEEHKLYVCLPEPNNPHDAQALGIVSARYKRIAFVPRVFTEHWSSAFPGVYTGMCVVVAYCTGHCTPKSAQCLYNVYQITGSQQQVPPVSTLTHYVPDTPYSPVPPPTPVLPPALIHSQQQQQPSSALKALCTACRGPANRFILPCRHYACCSNCASRLYGQACPTCQAPVSGTTTL